MLEINNWLTRFIIRYPDKTERAVYLLLFLFPIAGMSIRHWITNIFNLLVLISLFSLNKPQKPLLKSEKIFLWICASYFSMFIISSLANGWGQVQTYALGTELRFLFIIPLYLLIRRYTECSKWLLTGAILGGYVLFTQAYYDIFIIERATVWGVYSKNIIGPFAVLTLFFLTYYVWLNFKTLNKYHYVIIGISMIASLGTAGLSGSRGGYLGFLITSLACIAFFSKPRWMLASLMTLVLTTYVIYMNIAIVKNGVDIAAKEVRSYLKATDHVKDKSSTTSVGVRLEMLRTGILFIKDNPLVGIGPGNYHASTIQYIKTEKANPAISHYSHPHNTFLEVASSKGLLGLVTILLLFYYPAYIYIKDYKLYKPTTVIGLIHIIAISSFSLTDHSVVLMNNYTSILLLGIAIFFSSHLQKKH